MKNLLLQMVIISMLITTQSACAQTNKNEKNNTKMEQIERNYSVSDFNSIETEIVGNIEILQSSRTTLSANGDKDLIDLLSVKVEDNKLKLSMEGKNKYKKWNNRRPRLTIYISTPQLSEIKSEGVGNIKLMEKFEINELKIDSEGVGNISAQHLTADFLKIKSEGVGNISMKGTVNNLEINTEGVGNINTEELKAKHARVISEGVGNVSCHASESVEIESDGIGNVTYYGNPQTKKIEKNGLGKVRAK